MDSRTQVLLDSGAVQRGMVGEGSTELPPFAKWPESYAYIEGQVTALWEGAYGPNATLLVSANSGPPLVAGLAQSTAPIVVGELCNVSLRYSTLTGLVTDADLGKHIHVAHLGMSESQKSGNRYRRFVVLEIAAPDAEGQGVVTLKVPEDTEEALPF